VICPQIKLRKNRFNGAFCLSICPEEKKTTNATRDTPIVVASHSMAAITNAEVYCKLTTTTINTTNYYKHKTKEIQ